MKFSVLMSIYHKEKPTFFHQAMQSLWDEQTLQPSEIILVEDGQLTDELYKRIDFWENKLGSVLKRVPLKENQGLGKALNIGLGVCQHEYVARMDSDDICAPERFEKQAYFLECNPQVDILGGQIEEFEKHLGDLGRARKLPQVHEELVIFAKKRNPINHPSVMYRQSVVKKVGGYQDEYLYEDYALWVRMICNGAKMANLKEIILYMRSGQTMVSRRGGWGYAISEAKAQINFYRVGFLSFFEMMRNIALRFPVRVVPDWMRNLIYKKILRN